MLLAASGRKTTSKDVSYIMEKRREIDLDGNIYTVEDLRVSKSILRTRRPTRKTQNGNRGTNYPRIDFSRKQIAIFQFPGGVGNRSPYSRDKNKMRIQEDEEQKKKQLIACPGKCTTGGSQ